MNHDTIDDTIDDYAFSSGVKAGLSMQSTSRGLNLIFSYTFSSFEKVELFLNTTLHFEFLYSV